MYSISYRCSTAKRRIYPGSINRPISSLLAGMVLFSFAVIFTSCSEDSTGPDNRTASGIWNLHVTDPADNVFYDYASNAIMEDDNGTLTLTFPPVLRDTIPYQEIWEGRLDESAKVHFSISSENSLTGERTVLEIITRIATFNSELTMFQTEGLEMLDAYGNVIGYSIIRGLKVGNQ